MKYDILEIAKSRVTAIQSNHNDLSWTSNRDDDLLVLVANNKTLKKYLSIAVTATYNDFDECYCLKVRELDSPENNTTTITNLSNHYELLDDLIKVVICYLKDIDRIGVKYGGE